MKLTEYIIDRLSCSVVMGLHKKKEILLWIYDFI